MNLIISGVIGKLCGIYIIAVFLNFIIRKIRGNDNLFQKILATIMSVSASIILTPNFFGLTPTTGTRILSGAFISFICGLIVLLFFLRNIRLKKVLLIVFYGCLFYVPTIIIYKLILSYFLGGTNLEEAPILIFGLIASLIFVNDRKLPWTKDL